MGPVAVDALRSERAESTYWATYARNIPTSDDTRDTGAVPVAGGYAICLQDTFVVCGLGVGTARPLRADDLRIVDEFYGSRGLVSRIELHPRVAERDATLLSQWGYRLEGETAVMETELGVEPPSPDGLGVDNLTGRRLEWTQLLNAGLGSGMTAADTATIRRTTQVCASAASALMAIRVDGRLAGGGALGVTGDAALLFCAATLPQYRRRGVHTALLNARLALGRSRGATFAFLTAEPESPAYLSAAAAGFTTAYVRRRLRKL